MKPFPKEITKGDKYFPALKIEDQSEADEYLEACVQHSMLFGRSRDEAESFERKQILQAANASHQDYETIERVCGLFHISTPPPPPSISIAEFLGFRKK